MASNKNIVWIAKDVECLVYFKKVEEWANLIQDYVIRINKMQISDNALNNSVLTLYELTEADSAINTGNFK